MSKNNNKSPKEYFNDFDNILDYKSETDKTQRNTILKGIIESTENLMDHYAGGITYGQLRNILQIVKDKKYHDNPGELLLAVPKLAYTEGRHKPGSDARKLIAFMRELAMAVNKDTEELETSRLRYEAFEEIMNTIVAYHKINSKN